jgi:hypothetical protein
MRDDSRNAFRSLRFSPNFTAVALTVLALGIGAGTAIFSVVDAVVLRGLPFHEHDRLVAVLEHDTRRSTTFGGGQTTPQTYVDWRRMQESFEAIAGAGSYGVLRMRNEAGEPIDGRGLRHARVLPGVSCYTDARARVHGRGRDRRPAPRRDPELRLLAAAVWRQPGGDRQAHRSERSNARDCRCDAAAICLRQFAYPVGVEFPTEVYWPIAFTSDDKVRGSNRNYNWLAIARLKPGVSIEQAHDQMNRVAVALDEQYPKFNPGMRVRVVTLHYHPGRKSPSSASSETSVISARKRRRGRSATCRWRRTASQE